MTIQQHIAQHIREAINGNNWTDSNMRDVLTDVRWEEAVATPMDTNTIAVLVFHIGFYLNAVLNRLNGTPLQYTQEDTLTPPPVQSEEQWQELIDHCYAAAEALAQAAEKISNEKLEELNPGNQSSYYKNLHGVVEHTYYHLGQIILLKKLIRSK